MTTSVRTIPVRLGVFHYSGPRGRFGVFRPDGPIVELAPRPNPFRWKARGTLSARIVVGFNVGKKRKWKLSEVKKYFRRVREEQGRLVDATFLAQEGFYTHKATGDVVDERGVQILVINVEGLHQRTFTSEMRELSEKLAKRFQQEEVILDLMKSGVSKGVFGVYAPRRR